MDKQPCRLARPSPPLLGVDHDALVAAADKAFGKVSNANLAPAVPAYEFHGSELKYRDDSKPTATYALALEGCSWASPDYYPLLVASSVSLESASLRPRLGLTLLLAARLLAAGTAPSAAAKTCPRPWHVPAPSPSWRTASCPSTRRTLTLGCGASTPTPLATRLKTSAMT